MSSAPGNTVSAFMNTVDCGEIVLNESAIIGRSNFGTVYKTTMPGNAKQTVVLIDFNFTMQNILAFEVAVKKFYMSSSEMGNLVKNSASREAKALTELDHDNIIKLLGLARSQSHPCIILEYADGDKLYIPVLSLHLISRYTGKQSFMPGVVWSWIHPPLAAGWAHVAC